MAEALVGGAFLSGFINVLFDRFLSPEAANLILGKKLDQELLGRLKTALCAAKALLTDAERKQFHIPIVKEWLDSLKDAVYEADDLLDHVFTKAATQKQVSNFLPRFLRFKDREMVNKMEEIVRKIETIEKRKFILGLEEIPMESMTWKTPSTSLVKGNIYGRENDQDAIIKILNDNSEDKLSVIPIVGMGGVGKTTLAQWVYSNQDLMKEFDLKAWVSVSEEFDILKITKTIIEAVTSRSCDMKDLNLLQLDLEEKLRGKKFFIVLDDVWSDDRHTWDHLQKSFQYGAMGSKILVTTRIKDVASVVQTCLPYHLSELSDEYCWSVFADNACFLKSNGDSILEEIGRKIVQKCKGLPLAAETLGGLLRRKHDIGDWNTILMSDIWEFSIGDSKVIPALLISYYHLPPHLKRCFIYCSLYPKDYRFNKDELILLWLAEDLLRPPKRGETLEEVGYECFDDLVSRLFFKQFSKSFVMHDLLHDLAIFVAGDFYLRLEELGKAYEISIHTRHLSYGRLSHPISKNFGAIGRVKSLRTLLQIGYSTPSFSIESIAFIIPSKFKYLRVLSLCFWELDVLPDSIGELIHLRYLDLSKTSIKALPESLSNLYNLQILKLIDCDMLTMLPNGMQNLVNMRHLDISGTALEEMPRGMSKLKHLHLLSYFIVGEHEENKIKELGELSNLYGSFSIRKLENVTNSSEAVEARIMDKKHIENLYFEWSSRGDMVTSSETERETERDIFDKLQPHKGLKVLEINRYKGTIFPIWVGQSSYHNMTRVSLKSCNNCCMLPSLGQLPSLRSLEIEDFEGLKHIGAEFYKNDDDHSSLATPFPSLEDLSFHNMSNWEVWCSSEFNAFLQLKTLSISYCPRLTGDLPTHLPALETLEIHSCNELVSSLPRATAIRELSISCSDKVGLEEIPLSLQSLRIEGCQPVESMFQAMTISQPTCLQSLKISNCSSTVSIFKGLSRLEIVGPCDNVKSFPKEGLLPQLPSLTTLELSQFSSLETLECKELLHLTSLEVLIISECPKLENMAGERLPASLIGLLIYRSPLLEERCKMKDPQIWPIISHIRRIEVTGRWVS